MTGLRVRWISGWAVLLVLSFGGPLAAQSAPAAPTASPTLPPAPDSGRPQKSAYGTMSAIDKSLSAVAMKTRDGKKLAWKFPRGSSSRS